jgi:hypothetical protein
MDPELSMTRERATGVLAAVRAEAGVSIHTAT